MIQIPKDTTKKLIRQQLNKLQNELLIINKPFSQRFCSKDETIMLVDRRSLNIIDNNCFDILPQNLININEEISHIYRYLNEVDNSDYTNGMLELFCQKYYVNRHYVSQNNNRCLAMISSSKAACISQSLNYLLIGLTNSQNFQNFTNKVYEVCTFWVANDN